MAKSHLRLVAPAIVNRTVAPRRLPNADLRTREHLTEVPTQRIAALPDTVSPATAAALPVAGLTALRTLRHGAPLLGKRVLITGTAGGVGHLAVQLAARSGAHVTAVAGRPERTAGLRELGATEWWSASSKRKDGSG